MGDEQHRQLKLQQEKDKANREEALKEQAALESLAASFGIDI